MASRPLDPAPSRPSTLRESPLDGDASWRPRAALPLGALAAGLSLASWAQTQAPTPPEAATSAAAPTVQATPAAADGASAPAASLRKVTVKARSEPTGKETLRVESTRIGKGQQELRDIPQSMTVMTERLLSDRNADDLKEALHHTAGITFLSGETGEEDIRLRGFSLTQAGDVYVDGLRDPSLYERDTFNDDRLEVLKGSASMLFGRGSTGGVVNQVNKIPLATTRHEVSALVGTGEEVRLTGDFNFATGENEALRLNVMRHYAENYGARVDKKGLAAAYTWGMGQVDELTASFYALEYDNRPNYNHPWFLVNGEIQTVLKAKDYYGLASDYNRGSATYGTLTHTHRFSPTQELRTTLRTGRYERDLWASALRWGTTNGATTTLDNVSSDTLIARTPKGRKAISENTYLQSDYNGRHVIAGLRHQVTAGADLAYEDARRNNNFAGTASGLTTTVGTPNDGDWQADNRGAVTYNTFVAKNLGLYTQDVVSLTDQLKLVGGLRFDRFEASYTTATTTSAAGVVTPGYSFSRADSLWSPRLGLLLQPSDWSSYHVSYGTSYNTSGDTYQFTPASPTQRVANTAPEKSRNLELGGKFDLADGKLSLGVALFRSEKYNERNTDPDTAATQELLSGKRHATGLDVDVAGRLSSVWDTFLSWTWIPDARIDRSNVALNAAGTGAQVQGDRPGLTPRHSASLWSTYKVMERLRLGFGVNHRSSQSPEGARQITAPGFTTYDAMAEVAASEAVTVKLNVTNLTDKTYADALYRGFYTPGAARSAQLQVTTRF